ncbi:MAG: ABC transporter ATP-binding protein [Caulobacterales bacterium]|uniref:ABC transporter ATP-binding protein n=1 Tax=Glycocaulis sp. TaxID=1969725 RepID=UPI003F9F0F41
MVLDAQALTRLFPGGIRAVDAVSFGVAEGELLALVGESGCGKTTTLKMINRLLEPSSGTVRFKGEDIAGLDPVQLRRRMGWVMQGDGLFPHFTVAENIAVTPRLAGWSEADTRARVPALLELVQLDPAQFRNRYPAELSGGQRQRVGLARALAAEPPLLLMDEPFGALDPLTRDSLREDVQALRERLGFAAILVTHDMAEALLLADAIAVMRAGRIIQIGTPAELLNAPADPYVETLLATPRLEAERVAALSRQS